MSLSSLLHYISEKLLIFTDKIINTIEWLVKGRRGIVLNVWLRHRGVMMRPTNLGDDLNWIIVNYLSGKDIISFRYSFLSLFRPINYMCIGSIVDTLTDKKSIIWGSGAMFGETNEQIIEPYRVFAVRGPKTRSFLQLKGIKCPEVYGDPAILMPLVYPCKKKKRYKMGIIPHMIDLRERNVIELINNHKDKVQLIDIKNYIKWDSVIDQINECEFIVSSSLHGIILSDAYGIPNIWIKLSCKVKGDGYKFYDYFEGCGRKISSPVDLSNKPIDLNLLEKIVMSYECPPINNVKQLLDSCPFLSVERRFELKQKGFM